MKSSRASGITFTACLGTSLGTVLSWTAWHSLGWAILHGFLGWFYVIYYWFNYL